MDNLGKDDFKKLGKLWLDGNTITDVGCAKLVAALDAGALPQSRSSSKRTAPRSSASTPAMPRAEVEAALQKRLDAK